MDDRADIAERMEACFEGIQKKRMDGVPILNEALAVRAVGPRAWNGNSVFVLLTPWFMNLLLHPAETEQTTARIGDKRIFVFPAGRFEFIFCHEEEIGPHWMCSLFSPVLEFGDQETALAAAEAALAAVFDEETEPDPDEAEIEAMWNGELPEADDGPDEPAGAGPRAVSRRRFLRGEAGREEQS